MRLGFVYRLNHTFHHHIFEAGVQSSNVELLIKEPWRLKIFESKLKNDSLYSGRPAKSGKLFWQWFITSFTCLVSIEGPFMKNEILAFSKFILLKNTKIILISWNFWRPKFSSFPTKVFFWSKFSLIWMKIKFRSSFCEKNHKMNSLTLVFSSIQILPIFENGSFEMVHFRSRSTSNWESL